MGFRFDAFAVLADLQHETQNRATDPIPPTDRRNCSSVGTVDGPGGPGADLDAFEERAAILEYDAGFPRDEAEQRAAAEQGFASAGRLINAAAGGATFSLVHVVPPKGVATNAPPINRSDDCQTLLTHLQSNGPTSYGAAASALGWGATRAWQAEARLRAGGRVRHDEFGRMVLAERTQ